MQQSRQCVALAELAETYAVDIDTLIPELVEKTIRPGDEGTPGVSEFLCLELGPALGVSRRVAFTMVASVLNLKYRHPLTWDAFLRGLVPRWQADVLVGMTAGLGPSAAAWVDQRIAWRVGRVSFQRLRRLTRGWVAQADPGLAARREASARDVRRVVFGEDVEGTTDVWASVASRDAVALNKTLCELAVAMGQAGDDRSNDQRRAAALGVLADPAAALSWLRGPSETTQSPTETAQSGAGAGVWCGGCRGSSVVYVHLAGPFPV